MRIRAGGIPIGIVLTIPRIVIPANAGTQFDFRPVFLGAKDLYGFQLALE